jgi:hypothetical protein
MKRIICLLTGLFFSFSVFTQISDTTLRTEPVNTRNLTIKEAVNVDSLESILKSSLLKSFKGIGIDDIKEVYSLNRQSVDSLLEADSLNPNFWRVYGYQAAHLIVKSNESPKTAMSVFLPLFIIIFLLVVVIYTIKTIFIRPYVADVTKPENDPD